MRWDLRVWLQSNEGGEIMVGTIVGDYTFFNSMQRNETINILEERGLSGKEGIEKIVGTFVKRPVFDYDEMSKPISSDIRREVSQKQKRILEPMRSFLQNSYSALPRELTESSYAFTEMIDAYAREELSLRYGVIDKSLFNLRQAIDVDGDSDSVEIPLFFSQEYDDIETRCVHEARVKIGEFGESKERRTTFSAKAPFIPIAAKDMAQYFLCDYHSLIGRLLGEKVIGSTLTQRLLSGEERFSPRLYVHWIPSDADLRVESRVVDNDPLLTANLGKTTYLLHQWQVDHEKPFQQYLDEFMVEGNKK